MNCTNCGNEMLHHYYSYYNHNANQCEIEIVECANCQIEEPAELAALREAGEKMAKQLKDLRGFQEETEARGQSSITVETEYIFNTEDATALAEWEAANK